MSTLGTREPTLRKPLRLWPGVVAVVLMLMLRYVVPIFVPEAILIGVIAELVGALVIVVWWMFFSRAPWSERFGALLLMVAVMFAVRFLLDKSIATGMMGMMFYIFAIPVLCLAFVAWAVATRNLPTGPRRAWLVAAVVLACGGWTLLRTDGITGDASSAFAWRWSKTAEERLLARAADETVAVPAAAPATPAPVPASVAPTPAPAELPANHATPAAGRAAPPAASSDRTARPPDAAPSKTGASWPGFRGLNRDSVIPGVRIETNWTTSPPVELWRRPIGPGWSSFAVSGDLVYTQEQRGDHELVACYNLTTGKPVWIHRDAVRFWESNAGAGPRATPTLSNGRVYTLGATGVLNALDAGTGAVVWSHNAASDTGAKLPGWGFSGSPLVLDNMVVAATSGRLIAYDLATGARRWLGPEGGGGSYSSPHLMTIGGVQQVVFVGGNGATGFAPADGTVLWKFPLPPSGQIVQPALTADGDLLLGEGENMAMRRVAVTHGASGWTVEERWRTIGLKPYFNDFVVHNGHAFGFDGSILACVDLKDGKRKWKGGRYGQGQLVLLRDQDVLLVLSEQGELALVGAVTDQFKELARFPAIQGKTWNHPVLVGDVLLVRNGEEMVAFRLALARS